MGNFGENLNRLAGMHGLTAVEASKLLGVSRQTYSAWTTGKREPNTRALVALRELFEVDPLAMMRMPPSAFIPHALRDDARYARTDRRIAEALGREAEFPPRDWKPGTPLG